MKTNWDSSCDVVVGSLLMPELRENVASRTTLGPSHSILNTADEDWEVAVRLRNIIFKEQSVIAYSSFYHLCGLLL